MIPIKIPTPPTSLLAVAALLLAGLLFFNGSSFVRATSLARENSLLTEELERFRASKIMGILSIPVEKTGRILVIEDAVRSLGRRFRDRT